MAAYRRVYDSRHLHADCQELGSAPEPYARWSSVGHLTLPTAYISSVVAGCAERQDAVAELESTFAVIKSRAESRQSGLEQALVVAEKFWDNMAGALATLKELQENTAGAEPPALEPDTIRDQQDSLEVSSATASWQLSGSLCLLLRPESQTLVGDLIDMQNVLKHISDQSSHLTRKCKKNKN